MGAELAHETAEEALMCAWSALRDLGEECPELPPRAAVCAHQIQIQIARAGNALAEAGRCLEEIGQGARRIAALPLVHRQAGARADGGLMNPLYEQHLEQAQFAVVAASNAIARESYLEAQAEAQLAIAHAAIAEALAALTPVRLAPVPAALREPLARARVQGPVQPDPDADTAADGALL